MTIIDTHTHLYLKEFSDDIDRVIDRACENGVEKFLLPNIDVSTIGAMHKIENKYKGKCYAMMGIHPCSVNENFKEELSIIRQYLEKRKYIAIGEIGMDLYWDKSFVKEQEIVLKTQLEWAVEFDIPVAIHSRNSFNEIVSIIKKLLVKPSGVFHCFTGNELEAREAIDLGFKLGIGGVLTFKNSGLADNLKNISLDNIILETDSPYLAPVPYRGKRNESAYVYNVAEKLADLHNVSVEQVAIITTQNAMNLFGLE